MCSVVGLALMVQCESARRRDTIMSVMGMLAAAAAVAVVVMSAGGDSAPVPRGERVMLLQKAATEKLSEDNKCDADCQQKADMVKEQMQSLRKEINGDYHSMTHFGDKAGYVPPPRSIRAQVMDGTLLNSDDGPAAPPPFSPNLSARASKGKAFGKANMKKLLRSQEPQGGHHSSTADSSILPPIISVGDMEKKMLRDTPATSNSGDGDTMSFLHPDRDSTVHVHSSHHHGHSAGKAKWAKEFNFVKHHSKARHSSGEATWAKDFSFVKHHQAKAAPTHTHARAVRNRGDAEPAVVKRAMQKALSFAP